MVNPATVAAAKSVSLNFAMGVSLLDDGQSQAQVIV
jgi:hypothetical protein